MNEHFYSNNAPSSHNFTLTDEEFERLAADYCTGSLSASEKAGFEAIVATQPERKYALQQMVTLWDALAALPEEQPSAALRENVGAMMAAYQQAYQHVYEQAYQQGVEQAAADAALAVTSHATQGLLLKDVWLKLKLKLKLKMPLLTSLLKERISKGLVVVTETFIPREPVWRAVAALTVVGLSFGAGWMTHRSTSANAAASANELLQLRGEMQGVTRMLAMSLLKQSSASERLRGVSLTATLVRDESKPDEEAMTTLLSTLTNDANVNVRLAAAEALSRFKDNPLVLHKAVEALTHEESPLVQITLLELLIAAQKQSGSQVGDVLRTMMQDSSVHPAVRAKIQQVLE
jgi:uncharacterized protein (UPF0147 family)